MRRRTWRSSAISRTSRSAFETPSTPNSTSPKCSSGCCSKGTSALQISMITHETQNMAVFCDFENVALGVRDAKYAEFDIAKVLQRLLLKGNISSSDLHDHS